jgi:predicted small metal-binding protein
LSKHIACGEIVDGCKFSAEAATEAELVEKVKAHAAEAHGVEEVSPELAARVKAAIQNR